MKTEICEVHCSNKDKVAGVKASILNLQESLELSEIFKAMGDNTRIRLLHALSHDELCVCELTEVLEISQSTVSHQLRVLRNLRLVKYRKEGKMVYYSLDDEHILTLFSQGLAHIRHR